MESLYFVPKAEFARIQSLKADDVTKVKLIAQLCRINTLYMITKAGSGHIGSSFSSLDIVAWLYLKYEIDAKPLQEKNAIFFSSKGHDVPGLYSVLAAFGHLDFELIHKLRSIKGLPGHPDVGTVGMVTNTGSLGMGISKAKGMVLANRLRERRIPIFVMTGDGELQEGQIWESLQPAANSGFGEITVIVDHNKIQSDTWVSKTSDLGDLETRFRSFGWHVERCDGNNIEVFSKVLERCDQIIDKPKVIIADTVKGKGISFMEQTSAGNEGHEDDLYRFHSGAPAQEVYQSGVQELIQVANDMLSQLGQKTVQLESVPWPIRLYPENQQRLVVAYSQALVKQAEKHQKILVFDADLVQDCGLLTFKNRFPNRFVECGIAEQDMVSQAGGTALAGYLPVVHSFACFLSARPNEHIYNNATEKTKIIYVGSLAGLLPGMPGHSHQAVRDIAALSGIPGLTMLQPCSMQETEMAVAYCINEAVESCYLRLTSIPCTIPYCLPENYRLQKGCGAVLKEGSDVAIFTYGPVMLNEVYKAALTLESKENISVKVINLPWLNYVDKKWLCEVLEGIGYLLTVDDHYVNGGQGDMLLSTIARLMPRKLKAVRKLGVDSIRLCGTNDEVLKAHGLDADSISNSLLELVKGKRP